MLKPSQGLDEVFSHQSQAEYSDQTPGLVFLHATFSMFRNNQDTSV